MNLFASLQARLKDLLQAEIDAGGLPTGLDLGRFNVEPPRDPSHGDLATNAAMVYAKEAKAAGSSARALADKLVAALQAEPQVESAAVAGPGFINVRLKPTAFEAVLRSILQSPKDFGRGAPSPHAAVNIEYVSANPTGPMHVGHARGAAFGDALAKLLAFAGREVTREYYINDAGAQVDVLARSAYLRYLEALGENIGTIPEGLYPGDYLKPVGEALAHEFGEALRGKPESEWLPIARARAIAAMMAMIRDDLAALGIEFDVYSSERALTSPDGGKPRPGRRSDRLPARQRAHLRRPAAAAEGRAGRRLGRSRADPVPLDRIRRRHRPSPHQVGRRLHLLRQRHRLSQDQDRPRLRRARRRLGRRPRRLCEAHAGGGERALGRRRLAGGAALPIGAADARWRAGKNVEALRRLRNLARSRR